jgi:agmatinase
VVGGDDSVPIPVLQAFGPAPIAVMQIDAHIDWKDIVRGERWGLSSTMRRASEMAHVASILQIGQRGAGSATQADVEAALRSGVTFVPAREVARDGIARALQALPEGTDIVICLDCDAIDPSLMPSVIGRVPGGLSFWDVADLIDGAATRGRIVAFMLTEFLPAADLGGLGALNALRLLAYAMGTIARQSVSGAQL